MNRRPGRPAQPNRPAYRFNRVGDTDPVFAMAMNVIGVTEASTYPDAQKKLVAEAATKFYNDSPSASTFILTGAAMTPFVKSAIACLKVHSPLLPAAGPDGKGGCVITAQVVPGPTPEPPAPAPAPTVEDACKVLNGTWSQATGCALPDNGDCAKQGGVWDGKVCSKTTPAANEVSSSSGLLIGGLIAAVAIGIVAMTLTQNTKKKGTSR